MLPHCHGGLGDTNPIEQTLGQAKICHNCRPMLLRQCRQSRPPVRMYLWGWQKPIFSWTDPPSRGATCPNKTNKSGGPKDVADACLPPGQSQTKMLSLSEWREWMGTMSGQPPGLGTHGHCHRVTDQVTVTRSIKQNWSRFLRQILNQKLAIRHLGHCLAELKIRLIFSCQNSTNKMWLYLALSSPSVSWVPRVRKLQSQLLPMESIVWTSAVNIIFPSFYSHPLLLWVTLTWHQPRARLSPRL